MARGVIRSERDPEQSLFLPGVLDDPVGDVHERGRRFIVIDEAHAPDRAVLCEEQAMVLVSGNRYEAEHLVEVELRQDRVSGIAVFSRRCHHGRRSRR